MILLLLWTAALVLTCGLAGVSRKLDVVPGRFVRAIAAYYAVAYLGRGLYLVVTNIAPGHDVPIADARLLAPDYVGGLTALAPLAVVGLAILIGSFHLASRMLSRWKPQMRSEDDTVWRNSAVAVLGIGWVCRMYLFASGQLEPDALAGRLAVAPTAALGIAVLCTKWRESVVGRVMVWGGALGEGLWSIHSGSKTYLLAAALFLYLDPNRKKISAQAVFALVGAALIAFAVIQPAKDAASSGTDAGSSLVQSVVTRFDLIKALTDADSAGPGSYMGTSEFVSRLAQAWLPQSFTNTDKTPSGVLWGQRMALTDSGVYLADGPTAEGYALYGWFGVISWNLVLGLVCAGAAFVVQGKRVFLLCLGALSLVASNALFERGVLGVNEALSTSLQVSVLGALPYFVVQGFITRVRRTRRRPDVARVLEEAAIP